VQCWSRWASGSRRHPTADRRCDKRGPAKDARFGLHPFL